MAESIQKEMDILSRAIEALEGAVPLIVTPSQHETAINAINQAADILKQSNVDAVFSQLSTTMKILNNGGSSLLTTVVYQGFILDILEMLTSINNLINSKGLPNSTRADEVQKAGEFLIRLTGRITNRYKIRVTFNPEYEAKSIRAFMLAKELQPFVRFLSLNPDISTNQQPNLENGFELDVLSQETPQNLHKLAGSILEVINVQIFTETRNTPVPILDPPGADASFDEQVNAFLDN
ncbi:MAG: hypothetical protein INQ03_13050 [Candidatus Heimdallarchaeota archaeon]|nr:hypothetical protein [Candidatus Heimdallarchaeota archaeon]